MVKNYAKFTAEIQKGINIKGSDVEVKLLIPLKAAQPYLNFLSNSQGNEVNIFVGDPQMSFDFEEEDDDDAYKLYQGGRRVTADASGVVTSVEQQDEQKDENQAELNLEESGSEGDAEHSDGQAEDPAGDPPPAEDGDELNDYEKEIMGESTTQKGSDLPEWMQQTESDTSGDEPHERSFEGDDQTAASEPQEGGGESSSEQVEISQEDLERFILRERPSFEDIPLDFPMFLEKRLNEGKKWLEISKLTGIPSSQIQPKWKKYKEKVAQMMRESGVV